MANPSVRATAIYIRGKRTITVNKSSGEVMPNRKALFGSNGYAAHSKGAVQARVEMSEFTPVAGGDLSALVQKVNNQEDIDIAVIYGGQELRQEMAAVSFKWDSDSEGGTVITSITCEGGKFDITG